MFYRWRVSDFVAVPAYELKRGDEIACANGLGLGEYGAIPFDDVTIVWGECVLLQYDLPVGAYAQSSETTQIAVSWRGNEPIIRMYQNVSFYERVLVRRNEGN